MYENFSFDLVPACWAVCFINECPIVDRCLRHLAGLHMPKDTRFGLAVYPTALVGGQCSEFKQIRIVHAAYGFNALFTEVKQKHAAYLRQTIKNFLGGNGSYYRYHHGQLLLMPEQQQWILDLFRELGYTDSLVFDGYKDIYDFT